MDVDSKEEYFIELILSRHARKLLTARSLRDLGKFVAHLDFNLNSWLARERYCGSFCMYMYVISFCVCLNIFFKRLRAARLDEFVPTLQELHQEFKWPYPSPPPGSSPQPHPHLTITTELFSPNSTLHDSLSPPKDTPTDHMTPRAATPTETINTSEGDVTMEAGARRGKTLADCYADESTSSMKRANRPPDLDLSPGRGATVPVELATQKLVGTAVASLRSQSNQGELDPTRSSTPTKHSGSISEKVSLIYKKTTCEYMYM